MGINLFILILIVSSIFVANIEQEVKIKKVKHDNLPTVTFNNSVLYILDEKHVSKMINSSQALSYKNKNELYDATILIKNKYNKTNTISAQYILDEKKVYSLYSNVDIQINQKNKIKLNSDFIKYDTNKNILSNNKPFELIYNNSVIIGDNLFFDNTNNIINAKNTHMKIKRETKCN
jgi:hypothetical protein